MISIRDEKTQGSGYFWHHVSSTPTELIDLFEHVGREASLEILRRLGTMTDDELLVEADCIERLFLKCFSSQDVAVRQMASLFAFTPQLQELALNDPEPTVRMRLALRHDARVDITERLVTDSHPEVRQWAWELSRARSNTRLVRLYRHLTPERSLVLHDELIKLRCAWRWSTTLTLKRLLATDSAVHIRATLAACCPDDEIKLLLVHDTSPAVRYALAGQWVLPDTVIRRLAQDPFWQIRAQAARHLLSEQLQIQLSLDRHTEVRTALAASPFPLSERAIRHLLADKISVQLQVLSTEAGLLTASRLVKKSASPAIHRKLVSSLKSMKRRRPTQFQEIADQARQSSNPLFMGIIGRLHQSACVNDSKLC